MTYLDALGRELAEVGIRGRLRSRILAETEDHLRSDEGAIDRFGDPHEVANAFAAELGTRLSREGAVGAFAALAVAGAVFAVSFVGLTFAGTAATESPFAAIASLLIVVAPQIAFVSGSLALLRVVRRRNDGVLSSAERRVVNRRTAVALGAGLVTMAALLELAIEYRSDLSSTWVTFTLIAAPVASALLLLAALPVARAIALRPHVPGAAGDAFDDLGLARYRGEPWRFAVRVALLVGIAVWLAGIVGSDPFDGLARGVFEALACLAGFGLLGRYLGLRA
ncbi:MAG TPA: hypothetical protein VF094_04400 [Gaiellaceae bacterium]